MGIVTLIAGVAVPFYMRSLRNAKIQRIQQTGLEYMKAVRTCLAVNDDDLGRCNTKAKIKFDCDDICDTMTAHDIHPDSRRSLLIAIDDLKACAVYRMDTAPGVKNKLTFNQKICAKPQAPPILIPFPVIPWKLCSSNSDCSAGHTCNKWSGIRGVNKGCSLPCSLSPTGPGEPAECSR